MEISITLRCFCFAQIPGVIIIGTPPLLIASPCVLCLIMMTLCWLDLLPVWNTRGGECDASSTLLHGASCI